MKKITVFLFCFLVLGLSACQQPVTRTYSIEGFAYYRQTPESETVYRAVSPEGVTVKVSQRINAPEDADQVFWSQAIRRYVPDKGYRLILEGETQGGRYFIFLVPGTRYDYFYFLHFFVHHKKLWITESGGQYAFLQNYQRRLTDFASQVEEQEKKTPQP